MDWSSVLSYSISEVRGREEVTDSVYAFMIKNDVNESAEVRSNPAKLLKLFQITQAILKIKGAEAEAAFEELAEQSGGVKRKTSSERVLRDKIDHLEEDLKHRELTIKDLRRELEANRSRWKRLESENVQLEQRVDQFREQMEFQRDSYNSRQDESSDFREILRKKDQEMNAVLDQIEEVEKEKGQLEGQLQQITEHCDTLTQRYEEATSNVHKLQELLKESDYDRHQLKGRNQILEQQVVDLQQLTAHKSDTDDQILSLVNAKSVEWEGLLANKDTELIDCHKQIQQLHQQLTAASMDTDKASVIKLSHALQQKEQQVNLLHEELQEATSEITQLCNKVEELKQQNSVDYQSNSVAQEVNKLQQEQAKLQRLLEEEKESRALAEEQLLGRDGELAELYQKVRLYESGQFGLSEAVAEIKQKKAEIAQRDEQIVKLTQLVGEVDIQLNTALEENEALKQKLGMSTDESVDLSELRHKKNVQLEELKNMNRDLSQEVHRLEEEKLELRKQVFKLGTPTKKASVIPQPMNTMISKQLSHQQQIKQLQSVLDKTKADLAAEKKAVALSNKEAAKLRVLLKERQQEVDNLNDYHEKFNTTGRLSVTSTTPDEADTAHLRNEVARLNIENSELRTKLEEHKQDLLSINVTLEQRKLKIEQLHSELHLLSERESRLKLYQPVSLSQNLSPNTRDSVTGLTEHLMQCLQELASNKKTIQQLTAALEKYKTKFAIIISQQGILYREYNDAKQSWENERNKLLQQKTETEEAAKQLEAKSTHLLSVQEALSADPDANKQKLSEFSRKITTLRVNERSLSRKLAILQASESSLKKENAKLKQDIVQLENSVTERLGYLQRYKETAAYKISSLQSKMATTVPVEELNKANRFQEEMTMKYAQLLHHQETDIMSSHTIGQLQAEVRQLQRQLEATKQELMTEKNRSVVTQQLLGTNQSPLGQGDDHITSHKIATLEIKELNERQRADLATTQLLHCQTLTTKLQERNKELENKIVELTTLNLEGHNKEQQLRMQLVHSVSHETKASLDRRINNLEHSEAALKLEVSRLKDAVEMAKGHSALMALEEKLRNNEISSLHQQLLEHQTKSDDKATIGKLHRQLTSLQTSETIALQQLEQANAKIKSLEASLLALEKSCDDKDQIIISCRHEAADKIKHLQSTIQELHRQCSGAIQLPLQEKYSSMILKLQEDKIRAEQQLAEVTRQHGKVGDVRMKEVEQERRIIKLQEEVKLLNETIKQQEMTIAKLQENSFSMIKSHEERQQQWEMKESELEQTVKKLQHPYHTHHSNSEHNGVPNDGNNVISKLRIELLESHQKMLKVDDALKDANSQLLEKDKELTQLRMMLENRSGHSVIPNDNLVTSQQLKLAQDTIKNLKDLAEQKEKAADKYQSLLEKAREEMQSLNKSHKKEVDKLMQQIHSRSDNTFSKLKQAALDAVNTPAPKLPTEQQLARLQELEELLKEKEASIVTLMEKLETTKISLQAENHALSLKHDKEIKKLQSLHERTLVERNFIIQQKDTKVLELEQELEVVEGELSAAREQAPSRTMKNLVDKLKTQLQVKEKQHKALNQALKQVRADLVEATQSAIKGHVREHENDQTIQEIVNKRTAELKVHVSTLNAEVQRYKERNTNNEQNVSKLTTEVSDLKQVLLEKDNQIKSLQTTLEATQSQVGMLESRKRELERQNEELQQQLKNDNIVELQKRCQILQEQVSGLEQKKQEPNSNRLFTSEKSTEKVLQWEESKKWQKKVDSLKTKLADSGKEIEALQKQVKSLKDIVERSDREKSYLHKKLQSIQKYPSHVKTPVTDNNDAGASIHQTEQLKKKIHQLEEEVAALKHTDVTESKSELSVLKAIKQQQDEYIQSLEAQLSSRDFSKEFNAVKSQLQKLQQQLLDREKENIQLQFQYEQAVVDLPRLQNRIKDLEHYNEILKATKQQDNERNKITKTSSQLSAHRVSELEKVISAMKKVMERLQEENESLKKSAAAKKNVETLKPKETDNDGPSSPLKQFEKLTKENDKLRKDLKKEVDNSENLQLKISRLKVENNKLQDEMQKMLSTSSETLKRDVTIHHEEEAKKLRNELDKKNVMLQEVRKHLQSASQREKEILKLSGHTESSERVLQLIHERDNLKHKVDELQKQLNAFDPKFFEELEDLKYNYQQALKKNILYEEKLDSISRQHGIDVSWDNMT